jgi:hypothetical protein
MVPGTTVHRRTAVQDFLNVLGGEGRDKAVLAPNEVLFPGGLQLNLLFKVKAGGLAE